MENFLLVMDLRVTFPQVLFFLILRNYHLLRLNFAKKLLCNFQKKKSTYIKQGNVLYIQLFWIYYCKLYKCILKKYLRKALLLFHQ